MPASLGIQVASKAVLQNSTLLPNIPNDAERQSRTLYRNFSSSLADSELSASERNRRLIPYMAFYLPPTEYPVNQQYAVQRPKSNQQQPPPTAAESAGPLPPPEHIPIPTAYVRMKVPAAATGTADSELPYPPQPYPPSAGDVYHSISYGGQHPLPSALSELRELGSKNPPPLLHLLPPGAARPSTGGSLLTYKELNAPVKHKTVQHFPPLPTPVQTPHLPQQQLQTYRQRTKQSKINLTPFTPSNSLPGHFVPIIYTPLHSNSNNNNNNHHNNNANDYDIPTVAVEAAAIAQEQQPQQLYKNSHKQLQQQQQIAGEYTLPTSQREHHHQQQQQQQQPPHQVQFIAVTGPPTGSDISASPIYHVINEASQPLSAATLPQRPTLITLKQQQQQQQLPQYRHKYAQFHASNSDNFFDSEQQQQYEQQQQQPQQQQQQQYADNMTPQEKYVMYLQQRIRYNKQQQQQQQQKQRERAKEREHYLKQQQQPQIFVIGSTVAPVATVRPIDLPSQYYQQQQPPQQQHPNPSAQEQQPPQQQQQQQQPQYNYPQHSPIGHAVYTRPELPVPANHQLHSKPAQQVLHIPLRTIASDLDTLQQQQQYQSGNAQQQLVQANYPQSGSASPPQYVDYIIDEPKQSLDDESQAAPRPQPEVEPTLTPPQAAYIVITASPQPPESSNQEHYVSTVRPVYKQPPTLRLRPVPHYAARRPTITTARPANAVTPQYVYVSNKPSYGQVLAPTPKTKLQPAFGSRVKPTMPPQYDPAPAPKLVEQPQFQTPVAAVIPKPHLPPPPAAPLDDPNQLPDIRTSSLAEILHKLQASNHLPQTLTPDNIDNSIKTLITILNNLKHTQTIVPNPPQYHEKPAASPDYDYNSGSAEDTGTPDVSVLTPVNKPNKHPGPSTGRPGIDYPNYADIPHTSFDCGQQRYKGFFGDPETSCQVWHYCDLNGGKASFLCPNGTIFSQIALTCDWWFNVKCSTTPQLYVLNERLYKYILPFTPKFPEDYSGPLVDKYLAMKFQEMEEKMRLEKEKTATTAVEATTAEEAETSAEQEIQKQLEEETTIPTATAKADNIAHTTKQHETINSQVSEQSSERNLLIDDEVQDISQRGSYDNYETSTSAAAAITREVAEVPLSLMPIVVSSTVGPDYDTDEQRKSTKEQLVVSIRDEEQKRPVQNAAPKANKETTKISVEKVEVIEIKSDGTTGHLMPTMYFTNGVKKK